MNMILRALMVSVWFMALTFPLVVLKVDALNDTILFRWENMASIGVGAFVLSIFWRWSMERKARGAVSTGPSPARLRPSGSPSPAIPASASSQS